LIARTDFTAKSTKDTKDVKKKNTNNRLHLTGTPLRSVPADEAHVTFSSFPKEPVMDAAAIPEVRKSAEESFASGFFCAESVVLAIAKAQGVDSEILPKAATAFCSGMSRTCGTCGALTGAIMGVSLSFGRSTTKDSIQPSYTATQQLIRAFENEFGSRDCKVLLGGCDLSTPEGQALFKEQKLSQRCQQITGKAAEIAARVIVENNG
jgi:C_GCAxxG_C_C family probable redox protein